MEQSLNIGFEQTTPVTCEECGGIFFEEAIHIRKASGILTGSSKPSYIPIPVFACKECGHVNSEFLPKEMGNLD